LYRHTAVKEKEKTCLTVSTDTQEGTALHRQNVKHRGLQKEEKSLHLLDSRPLNRYSQAMGKKKSFYYVIDGLTQSNGETLKKALSPVSDIHSVTVRPQEGIVEVIASRNVEQEVKVACEVAGTTFRVRAKKRQL